MTVFNGYVTLLKPEEGELALHPISCPAVREREASALAVHKLRNTVVIVFLIAGGLYSVTKCSSIRFMMMQK
jgi:hypothetical protein